MGNVFARRRHGLNAADYKLAMRNCHLEAVPLIEGQRGAPPGGLHAPDKRGEVRPELSVQEVVGEERRAPDKVDGVRSELGAQQRAEAVELIELYLAALKEVTSTPICERKSRVANLGACFIILVVRLGMLFDAQSPVGLTYDDAERKYFGCPVTCCSTYGVHGGVDYELTLFAAPTHHGATRPVFVRVNCPDGLFSGSAVGQTMMYATYASLASYDERVAAFDATLAHYRGIFERHQTLVQAGGRSDQDLNTDVKALMVEHWAL